LGVDVKNGILWFWIGTHAENQKDRVPRLTVPLASAAAHNDQYKSPDYEQRCD
jgi:hypothetical protein